MSVRAKFQCTCIEPFTLNPDGPEGAKRVVLSRWNPPGELNVVIEDPDVLARLKVGGRYYIDLIVAD